MNFLTALKVEFIKTKRSKIMPLLFIAPILVVVSGIANISMYFTPEYTSPWTAMFIQSALLYAYYLLPFSMIVVCVMLSAKEKQNNGMIKMLSLPISRASLSLAKFCILIFYFFVEIFIFFTTFLLVGIIVTKENTMFLQIPLGELFLWCGTLFLTMLPCVAVMWAITILFDMPIVSIGLNLLFVIGSVFIANTKFWIIYPYCYSGYYVSSLMKNYSQDAIDMSFQWLPFSAYTIIIFLIAIIVSVIGFGKKELK